MGNLLNRFSLMSLTIAALLPACAPSQLESKHTVQSASTLKLEPAISHQEAISKDPALSELLSDDRNELSVSKIIEPSMGLEEAVQYGHKFDGIPVIGSRVIVERQASVDKGLNVAPLKSEENWNVTNRVSKFDLDSSPKLSVEDALESVQSKFEGRPLLSEPTLKILPSKEGSARLVYIIKLGGVENEDGKVGGASYWVDAHTGDLIAEIPHELHADVTNIVKVTNSDKYCHYVPLLGYTKEGDAVYDNPMVTDISRCSYAMAQAAGSKSIKVWKGRADADVKRAFDNAKKVLGYYASQFNRKSYDNKNSPLTSLVHVGKSWGNAFWNSEQNYMAYGDGDVTRGQKSMTLSADVAGHEMTHAVIGSTANLIYMQESGALNEAIADFFGIMISHLKSQSQNSLDPQDYRLGTDLYASKSKGIRDLARPSSLTYVNPETGKAAGYPAHVKSKYVSQKNTCGPENDMCGVHLNATIPGHALYLAAKRLGEQKVQKILYVALARYLTETSDFSDFRSGMKKSCLALGKSKVTSGSDCTKLDKEFSAVGI